MENTHQLQELTNELEAEKAKLKSAIENDIPFEEAKPIRQRISRLEKLIGETKKASVETEAFFNPKPLKPQNNTNLLI